MRSWIVVGWLVISACGNKQPEVSDQSSTMNSTATTATQTVSNDTDTSFAKGVEVVEAQPIPIIKSPSGIYQFTMPYGDAKILHTVAFYPGRFRLQEEYTGKGDSTVITEGTWAPSQGFIWLYKEQLVRGRYSWKGDTLQYFNPRVNKRFSMVKLASASANAAWLEKRKEGALLFAVGTEPFWSVEVSKADTLIFSSPEWTSPLKIKLSQKTQSSDSTLFTSSQDSVQLVIYPFFCNDGMSDFIYPNKVSLTYKGRVFKGCGQLFN